MKILIATMQFKIITKVHQDYLSVMEGFTEELFLQLNPPFPPVKLKRFDGCNKGDIVAAYSGKTGHLILDKVNTHQVWSYKSQYKLHYFIDYF